MAVYNSILEIRLCEVLRLYVPSNYCKSILAWRTVLVQYKESKPFWQFIKPYLCLSLEYSQSLPEFPQLSASGITEVFHPTAVESTVILILLYV